MRTPKVPRVSSATPSPSVNKSVTAAEVDLLSDNCFVSRFHSKGSDPTNQPTHRFSRSPRRRPGDESPARERAGKWAQVSDSRTSPPIKRPEETSRMQSYALPEGLLSAPGSSLAAVEKEWRKKMRKREENLQRELIAADRMSKTEEKRTPKKTEITPSSLRRPSPSETPHAGQSINTMPGLDSIHQHQSVSASVSTVPSWTPRSHSGNSHTENWDELCARLEEKYNEVWNLQEQLKESRAEVERLRVGQGQSQVALNEALGSMLEKASIAKVAEERVQALETELQTANEKIQSLTRTGEISEPITRGDSGSGSDGIELRQLQSVVESLQRQLTESNLRYGELEGETAFVVQNLQAQLEKQVRTCNDQIDQLSTENTNLKTAARVHHEMVKTLEAEKEELQAKFSSRQGALGIDSLVQEIAQHERNEASLSLSLKSASDELSTLQKAIVDMAELSQRCAELQVNVDRLERERAQLIGDNRSMSAELAASEERVYALEKELEDVGTERDRLGQDKDDLVLALNLLQRERDGYSQQLSDLEEALQRVNGHGENPASVASMAGQQRAREELAAAESKLLAERQMALALRSEFDEFKSKMEEECRSMSEHTERLLIECNTLRESNSELMAHHDTALSGLRSLEAELEIALLDASHSRSLLHKEYSLRLQAVREGYMATQSEAKAWVAVRKAHEAALTEKNLRLEAEALRARSHAALVTERQMRVAESQSLANPSSDSSSPAWDRVRELEEEIFLVKKEMEEGREKRAENVAGAGDVINILLERVASLEKEAQSLASVCERREIDLSFERNRHRATVRKNSAGGFDHILSEHAAWERVRQLEIDLVKATQKFEKKNSKIIALEQALLKTRVSVEAAKMRGADGSETHAWEEVATLQRELYVCEEKRREIEAELHVCRSERDIAMGSLHAEKSRREFATHGGEAGAGWERLAEGEEDNRQLKIKITEKDIFIEGLKARLLTETALRRFAEHENLISASRANSAWAQVVRMEEERRREEEAVRRWEETSEKLSGLLHMERSMKLAAVFCAADNRQDGENRDSDITISSEEKAWIKVAELEHKLRVALSEREKGEDSQTRDRLDADSPPDEPSSVGERISFLRERGVQIKENEFALLQNQILRAHNRILTLESQLDHAKSQARGWRVGVRGGGAVGEGSESEERGERERREMEEEIVTLRNTLHASLASLETEKRRRVEEESAREYAQRNLVNAVSSAEETSAEISSELKIVESELEAVRKEMTELRASNISQENIIVKISGEIAVRTGREEELTVALNLSQNELKKIQTLCDDELLSLTSLLETTTGRLREGVVSLEEKHMSLEREHVSLEERYSVAQRDLEVSGGLLAEMKKQCSHFEEKIQVLTEKLVAGERDREDRDRERKTFETERDAQLRELESELAEMERGMREREGEREEEEERRRGDRETLEKIMTELEEEKIKFMELCGENAGRQSSEERAWERVREADTNNRRLQTTCDDLLKRVGDLETERDSAIKSAAESKHSASIENRNELVSLSLELAGVREMNNEISSELASVKKKNENLREEAKTSHILIRQMQGVIDTLNFENANLREREREMRTERHTREEKDSEVVSPSPRVDSVSAEDTAARTPDSPASEDLVWDTPRHVPPSSLPTSPIPPSDSTLLLQTPTNYTREIISMRDEMRRLQQMNISLQKQLASAGTSTGSGKNISKFGDEQEEEAEILRSESRAIRARYELVCRENEDLSSLLRKAETENKDLASARLQIAALKSQINNLESELERAWKENVKQREGKKERENPTIEFYEREVEKLKREITEERQHFSLRELQFLQRQENETSRKIKVANKLQDAWRESEKVLSSPLFVNCSLNESNSKIQSLSDSPPSTTHISRELAPLDPNFESIGQLKIQLVESQRKIINLQNRLDALTESNKRPPVASTSSQSNFQPPEFGEVSSAAPPPQTPTKSPKDGAEEGVDLREITSLLRRSSQVDILLASFSEEMNNIERKIAAEEVSCGKDMQQMISAARARIEQLAVALSPIESDSLLHELLASKRTVLTQISSKILAKYFSDETAQAAKILEAFSFKIPSSPPDKGLGNSVEGVGSNARSPARSPLRSPQSPLRTSHHHTMVVEELSLAPQEETREQERERERERGTLTQPKPKPLKIIRPRPSQGRVDDLEEDKTSTYDWAQTQISPSPLTPQSLARRDAASRELVHSYLPGDEEARTQPSPSTDVAPKVSETELAPPPPNKNGGGGGGGGGVSMPLSMSVPLGSGVVGSPSSALATVFEAVDPRLEREEGWEGGGGGGGKREIIVVPPQDPNLSNSLDRQDPDLASSLDRVSNKYEEDDGDGDSDTSAMM